MQGCLYLLLVIKLISALSSPDQEICCCFVIYLMSCPCTLVILDYFFIVLCCVFILISSIKVVVRLTWSGNYEGMDDTDYTDCIDRLEHESKKLFKIFNNVGVRCVIVEVSIRCRC